MTGVKRECRCKLARHVHGTRSCFQVCGCRCLPCRFAYDEGVRLTRHGHRTEREDTRVDRGGTRRRIEALHAIGWNGRQLGELLGCTYQAVHQMRTDPIPIYPALAEKVAALYDRLWDKPATGPHLTKTRNWAARNGFAPPLAWDDIDDPAERPWCPHQERGLHAADVGLDEIAIAEAMRGRPVHLTPAERAEAVQRMTARGYSAQVIAERLNVTQRCVVRRRTATGTERVA